MTSSGLIPRINSPTSQIILMQIAEIQPNLGYEGTIFVALRQ